MILPAPPLFLDTRDHVAADALAEEEERLEIGVHHRVPVGFGEIDRVGAADDPGIVDEDVDASEFGKHRIDERLHRADARQVGGEILAPAAQPAHLADGLVGGRSARGGDVGAGLGERERDPLPDAGVGAGDERDFSCEVEQARHYDS